MNKTVSINLAGMVFSIDENAYIALNTYINEIRKIFVGYTDGNEIVTDIEARIAEKFRLALTQQQKEAVSLADLERVQAELGSTQDFAQDAQENLEQSKPSAPAQPIVVQKFSRSANQKIVGGVAMGLAHYLRIDPVIVRILWLVSIALGGVGVLAYLILWVLLPVAQLPEFVHSAHSKRFFRNKEARKIAGVAAGISTYFGIDVLFVRILFVLGVLGAGVGLVAYVVIWASAAYAHTLSQRTLMHGTQANLSNMYATRQNQLQNPSQPNVFIEIIERSFAVFFRVLKMILGALLLLKSMALFLLSFVFVGFASMIYWRNGDFSGIPLRNFAGSLTNDLGLQTLIVLAFVLPAILLVYMGLRLLLGYRLFGKQAIKTLAFACIAVLATAFVFGFSLFSNFVETARYQKIQTITLPDTTRLLELEMSDFYTNNMQHYDNFDITLHAHNQPSILVKKSFEAQGANQADAQKNAQAAIYNLELQGNKLVFDNKIKFEKNAIFRFQRAKIDIYLPQNMVVKINNFYKFHLSNPNFWYDNWQYGFHDYDFEGKKYKIVNDTIKCQNCDDLLQNPKYWQNENRGYSPNDSSWSEAETDEMNEQKAVLKNYLTN